MKKLSQISINKSLLKLQAVSEQLLHTTSNMEKSERSEKGVYYTPKKIVDLVHTKISEQLGTDWKEVYTVWDCCSGKSALTKEYNFSDLFVSTLEQTDIDIVKQLNFNPNSEQFQYNFLNRKRLPTNFVKRLKEDKPILFLINPPFSKNSDSNVSKDFQQEAFNNNHILLGHVLFLYRIIQIKKKYKLSNVKICLISPLTFLTRDSFGDFRKFLFKNSSFLYGFIFNSYEFELDAIWTVGVSIFYLNSIDKKSLTYEIYNSDKLKTFYSPKKSEKFSTHLQGLNKIIKDEYGFVKKCLTRVSSAYKITVIKKDCLTLDSENLLGYFVAASNNVQSSNFTTIYTAPPTHNLYFCITKENFESVCINFAI